ncbi:hypothetical protein L9F63_027462, partial [Diploptera punctata]
QTFICLLHFQINLNGQNNCKILCSPKSDFHIVEIGIEPKFETVTRETVETYRGNRPERVTTSEKRDVFQNLPEEFRNALQKEQNGSTRSIVVNGAAKEKTRSRSPSISPDRPSSVAKQKSESKFNLCKTKCKIENDTVGAEGDFTAECLKAHNEYREKHGVPPLKLNKKLCKYSEEWAKRLATRGTLRTSSKFRLWRKYILQSLQSSGMGVTAKELGVAVAKSRTAFHQHVKWKISYFLGNDLDQSPNTR